MFSNSGPSNIGTKAQQANPRSRRQQALPSQQQQQQQQHSPPQMNAGVTGGGLFGKQNVGGVSQSQGLQQGTGAGHLIANRDLSDEQKEEIREAVCTSSFVSVSCG